MASQYDWSEYVNTKQQQQQQQEEEENEANSAAAAAAAQRAGGSNKQRRSSLLGAGIDFIMGNNNNSEPATSTSAGRRSSTSNAMYGGSIVRGLDEEDDYHESTGVSTINNRGTGGGIGGYYNNGTNNSNNKNGRGSATNSVEYFSQDNDHDDHEYGIHSGTSSKNNNEMVGVVNVNGVRGGRNSSTINSTHHHRGSYNGGNSSNGGNNSNCLSVMKRIRWKRVCCACTVLGSFIMLLVSMITALTNKYHIQHTVNTLLEEEEIEKEEAATTTTSTTAKDTTSSSSSSSTTSSATTSTTEEEEIPLLHSNPTNIYDIKDYIENLASSISGDDAFINGTSAHSAMEWLVQNTAGTKNAIDTYDTTNTVEQQQQRYVVTTIMFGLVTNSTYNEENNNNSIIIDTFISSSKSVCQWTGITCNENGYVTHLSLDGQNLKGTIPNEISYLKDLIWLDVSENSLTGTLPSTMDQLINLEHLYIEENNGQLKDIRDVNNNQRPSVCTLRAKYKLIHYEMDCYNKESSSSSSSNSNEVVDGGNVDNDTNDNPMDGTTTATSISDMSTATATISEECICCTKCYEPNQDNSSSSTTTFSSTIDYITSFFGTSSSTTTTSDNATATTTDIGTKIRQTIESLYDSTLELSYYDDVSSSNILKDTSTVQHKAFMWLLYEDTYFEKLNTNIKKVHIIERYVLAILYYQMINQDDTDENDTTTTLNWLYDGSHINTCQWNGIECTSSEEGNVVTHLKLGGKYLTGQIPYEIQYITNLQYIDLANNSLEGHIPTNSISKLTNLEILYLQENQLDTNALLFISDNNTDNNSASDSKICSLRYQHLKHFIVDCNVVCTCCTSCGKQ